MVSRQRISSWLIALTASLLLAVFISLPAQAQYGGSSFGECFYGSPSSICNAPINPPQPNNPPDSVSTDVENDGEAETATDEDRDEANGFEVYNDPDGSTEVYAPIDGDLDSKQDYLIAPAGEDRPTIYWDPDDNILSSITYRDANNDNVDDYLFDSDGDGTNDAYYDPTDGQVYRIIVNEIFFDIDNDGNDEIARNEDLDDSNGFEVFVDSDLSSDRQFALDGDGDGRADFLIDTDGDGIADTYWDPDNEISGPATYEDVDDDGQDEIVFDSDGDGSADSYFEPEIGLVFNLPEPIETSLRRLTNDGFGGSVYESIGRWLASLPGFAIQLLFLTPIWLLLLVIGLMIYQTRREVKRTEALKQFLASMQKLGQEKNVFVQLVSHYLRTPLTVISGFSEINQMGNDASKTQTSMIIGEKTKGIQAIVESLLSGLTSDPRLAGVSQTKPVARASHKRRFWVYAIPLFIIVGTSLLIQFLLVDFRLVNIALWLFITLVILAVIGLAFAIVRLRILAIEQQERKEQETLIENEAALDDAKNEFVEHTVSSLEGALQDLRTVLEPTQQSQDFTKINAAFEEIKETMAKFMMLSQLKLRNLRSPQTQVFSVADVLNQAITENQEQINAKKINVQFDPVQHPSVDHERELVGQVFASTIDNAVAYSPEGGTVTITGSVDTAQGLDSVTIADQGKGLTKDQLDSLFKPFTRAEGAEDFTHQGLGVSLYMDRLIMHYLGGDIALNSQPGKGTQVTVTMPLHG